MSQETLRIEIDSDTIVTNQTIKFKGNEYSLSSITGINYWEHKQSMNFVNINRIRSLVINFGSEEICIWSQSPILRKTKFQNIKTAYQAISSLTFKQRFNYYFNQFTTQGYFDYDCARIRKNGIIEDIKKPTESVSLCGAFTQGRIDLGFDFSVPFNFSFSDSTTVAVFDKKPKFLSGPKKAVVFTCRDNRDVIMSILKSFDSSI